MINITDADLYITQNVIDVEDWSDSDVDRKTRLLNVASRTLASKYANYVIPDRATYEFASYLASIYSDTVRIQRYGVKQFSIKGMAYTFRDDTRELYELIPNVCVEYIAEENGVSIDKLLKVRRIGRSLR